jgi:TetR/AcrR family transcriptional repressor of nem operon
MSDNAIAIMDAAERRMRLGGFNGFSFRDIAADVGIKSSSVHYHFPTKEHLVAAVIRRYTHQASEEIDAEFLPDSNIVEIWTRIFRKTLYCAERMCPCAVLGAMARDLPPKVATEIQGFFTMCLDKLALYGVSPDDATELLSTLMGAQVLSNALDDVSVYDRATARLMLGSERTISI